jgi:alanyl-tRNA synthetase
VTSNEIRKKFLTYFSEHGHTIVPSSSLVPDRDPTILFVNAGMVQFKNVFTGIEKRDYEKATSSQKCVRAGGKHNDFENVGKTLRHHTFFEMLGNFSFGNYFKKEAIPFAWEFLTSELNLDKKRLWITIYKDDNEADAIWRSINVPEDRIVRLGEKDNFWSMGDEGPCGPCSEIHYDLGEDVGCRKPACQVGCNCDRFLEIWNLVFMEFNRSKDGDMKKLPRPSIDTGMGLERITSLMQGKIGNYETDLFTPILKRLEDLSRSIYGENGRRDIAMRVIADHVRGATFIINDGVLPSKDGRGYVLRRIIRRALRYGKKLGIEKEFLYELSGTVVDLMADTYPEIKNNHPYIVRVLKGEEERFIETLNAGMRVYEEIAEELKTKGITSIPGDLAYKLYDTYGFPLDITQEMAEEDALQVDIPGFQNALKEQKTRSRGASKIKGEELGEGYVELLKADAKNIFVGYEQLESEGKIINILKNEQVSENIQDGEEGEIFLDSTPFYAESGGQTDDEGFIESPSGKAAILEVAKIKSDLFSHTIKMEHGYFKKGDTVHLTVDKEKRRGVSRNHTATHLLHYALRQVLGDQVKQSGSLVEKDRFRFDFTHFHALDNAELAKVEDIVNNKILDCINVAIEEKTKADAIKEGATALFEEKYGETVRVVKIGDFSAELCGGTHVRNTGEIGSFYITSEGSLAYGVRRIEAVTGKGAIEFSRRFKGIVNELSRITNTEATRIQERVEGIIGELQLKEKELEKFKEELIVSSVDSTIKAAPEMDGVKIVTMLIDNAKAEDLRKVTDIVRNKVKSCVVAVGSSDGAKGLVVVAVSKDANNKYNAGKIVKAIAGKYNGKGGGGPQIAQGGVPGERVADALKGIQDILDSFG